MDEGPQSTSNTGVAPPPASQSGHLPGRAAAGWLFVLVTALIWSAWIVWTRQAMVQELPIAWVGLIRHGVGAILLAPFWLRAGILPKGVPVALLALMVVAAGPGFVLAIAIGSQHAPAALVGVALSGATPIVVAIFSALFDKERFGRSRILGIVVVLIALAAISGTAFLDGGSATWIALAAGACAAVTWTTYTFTYPRTGLSPFAAAAVMAFWSTVLFLPAALYVGFEPILTADFGFLVGQVIAQGAPIAVALVTFSAAIRRLGSSRAGLTSALVPAVVALIAVPVLGESLEPRVAIGIVLVVLGVSLASGALRIGGKRP